MAKELTLREVEELRKLNPNVRLLVVFDRDELSARTRRALRMLRPIWGINPPRIERQDVLKIFELEHS